MTGADGVVRRRVESGHHRLLATMVETVRVTRCAWRAPNAGNLYPADAVLSLPAVRHSAGLAKLAVIEAVRGSFDAAHAAITARCGQVIGKRQIEDQVVAAAVDVDAFYAACVPQPRTADDRCEPDPARARNGYGSVIAPAGQVIRAAFDQADSRDSVHARTWVVLVDGDPHQIRLLHTEAARRSVTINIVCDLIHVLEYCWRGARCLHAADDPAAEQCVAAWALGLLAGNIDQVIDDMNDRAAAVPTDRRGGLETTVRYLSRHRDYLRYDHALKQGWPIATGVVEGTARHLVGDRLEITGARWGLAGAEAILKLRAGDLQRRPGRVLDLSPRPRTTPRSPNPPPGEAHPHSLKRSDSMRVAHPLEVVDTATSGP
ncbi:hypothetical protein [Streptosporangium sp. NPDC000396]|uniref:hypothetical protein n=1 Tax=Streptosporangium sp. NPDC000396 TaxID=3366185 RepID=UPI0036ADF227